MATFDYLPEELFYKMMYMLNYKDLMSLCESDTRATNLCQSPIFWRNKIDIIAPGRSNNLINKSLKIVKGIYRLMENSGYLYMFGNNFHGQLGLGISNNNIPIPALVPNFDNIVQISCGYAHTAFLTDQGDIYTCGYNIDGQLGQGDTIQRTVPTKINFPSHIRIKQVSCGSHHTIFITDIGNIYSFGWGQSGQLGLGNNNDTSVPTQIIGFNNVLQVSCGYNHSAFITEEGKIYSFGAGNVGQLGLGNSNDKSVPIQISEFNNVLQVSCSDFRTAFLTQEGKVYVCGNNDKGRLGIKLSYIRILTPVVVPTINDVVNISCTLVTLAFVTKDGNVYTMGDNADGQLGLGDTTPRLTPTLIDRGYEGKIVRVACGSTHTAFLSDRGEIYVCGSNFSGQLGLRYSTSNQTRLCKITNFTNIIYVSCGHNFTGFIDTK